MAESKWMTQEEIDKAAATRLTDHPFNSPECEKVWREKLEAAMCETAYRVKKEGKFSFHAINAWRNQLSKDARDYYKDLQAIAVLLFFVLLVAVVVCAALYMDVLSLQQDVYVLKRENVELKTTIDNLKKGD
jgi:hypothetical protein